MSILNREIMLLRTSMGDETGLLASIPFPCFYKFSNPITGNVDMEVTLINKANEITTFLYFGIADKVFNIVDSAGNVLGHEADFTVFSSIDKRDKNDNQFVFLIHVKLDQQTQSVKIYDGFYYLDTDPNMDAFNVFKYTLIPCVLIGIQGGYRSEVLDSYIKGTNPDSQLIIDRYSGIITGIIGNDDILFTRHNQIVLNNNEFCRLHPELDGSLNNLLYKYRYVNGEIVPIDTKNKTYTVVSELRERITRLRLLQINSSKWIIDDLLYNKLYSIRKVQKYLKPIKKEIERLRCEIRDTLNYIEKVKIANYIINRKLYLRSHEYKYYVSICLLIKDENEYLEEWLNHYDSIGVDHFYIYDNGSKIPISDTVKEISNGKFVDRCTAISYLEYKRNMQYECYEKCLSNYGEESWWIGFLDTDEFLDVEGGNIKEFLYKFEDKFCVWFPWEQHNANGHIIKQKNKTMIESFPERFLDPDGVWGKVFLQPYRTSYMYVHLGLPLDEHERVINVDGTDHIETYENIYNINIGQFLDEMYKHGKIRHYITRSFEEWIEKIKRGSCDPNFKRKLDQFFTFNPELSFLKEDPEVQKLMNIKQGYK